MLHHIPKWTPSLADMLPDLGNPAPEAIAAVFGVSVQTVKNWIKNGAPRAVLLSLFWLTQPGRSALDAELHNWAQLQAGLSSARLKEIKRLEAHVYRLAKIADFGSANDPLPGVSGIRSEQVVPLTPNPGLRPTMPPPSCEHRRLS